MIRLNKAKYEAIIFAPNQSVRNQLKKVFLFFE